jgi:hypothetical protein
MDKGWIAEFAVLYGALEENFDEAVPIEQTKALRTHDVSLDPYKGNRVEVKSMANFHKQDDKINTNPHNGLGLSIYLGAEGTPGELPPWDFLMRMAGLAPTVTPGESVAYTPVSEDYESATLYYVEDGDQLMQMTGCRSDVSFEFTSGELPKITFNNVLGSYNRPIKITTELNSDYSDFKIPLPFTFENTPKLNLDGYPVIAEYVRVNMNQEVTYRNVVNQRGAIIKSRAVNGELKFEATKVDEKDWWAVVESHSGTVNKVLLELQHGEIAGQIIDIPPMLVQLMEIKDGEINGKKAYVIPFEGKHVTGDDEFKLVLR